MILEVAEIEVVPGSEARFEEGVRAAAHLFQRAKGCRSMCLRRVLENPGSYLLLVEWEEIEDHTVGFRNSRDFQAWRELVADCFAAPPAVRHADLAGAFFGT